jgi:hypothetical protein
MKYTIAILCLVAGTAWADVQISAQLDRQQVSTQDQAVLTITVSGTSSNLPDPQLPGLPDFQVSNAGRSQSFSWVNGQTSASVIHQFVLTPKQEGRFTIPPVRLTADGKTLETAPLALEVVKGQGGALAPPPASGGEESAQGAPIAFVSGAADKTSVYVGEQITYSFRLHSRVPFLRQPQYQPPSTTGFWVEDLPPQRNYNTTLKGVPYQVAEIRVGLFPTHAGKATIGQGTLVVHIQNLSGDVFANFFGGGQEKILRTDPVEIQVKELPTPAPGGFQGAVGEYQLTAALDKTQTQVGQPLTLTVTISGRGNIKSLPDLTLPVPVNFRTFDANAATNIEKKDYRVQGSKVYKSVLIPTASGELTVPPVSFVYFDPTARAYKTLRSQSIVVHVKPAEGGATPSIPGDRPGTAVPGIKRLNEDIHYIKTPGSITSQHGPLYRSPVYIGLNALAVLGFLGIAIIPLYRRLFLSDPVRLRFREAPRRLQQSCKQAESALGRSEAGIAGGILARGLQDYLAAKLGWPEGEVSLRATLDALRERRVPEATIESVKQLWNSLDAFQFAPSQARMEDARACLASVRDALPRFEREIPWKE